MDLQKYMNSEIEKARNLFTQAPWEDQRFYANWLSQAYYIATLSTSFLGLCMIQGQKNPDFVKRCTKHIAEETGHEKLILKDLKQLGCNKPLAETPQTCLIYQPQYFRIVTSSPLSFVGYIFMLELLAPAYGPMVMGRVTNKNAISFLKVHAGADEDHIEQAGKILSSIEDSEVLASIKSNFDSSLCAYKSMILEICKENGLVGLAS